MEQHAVPRQITTFEFKLIGFLTIKQFIYLLLFAGIAITIYYLIPVPILNISMGLLVGVLGLGLAFFKYNERTLDIWLIRLVQSLLSPSQYYYMKNNLLPDFLVGVYVTNDSLTQSHLDAQQMLQKYMVQQGVKIDDTSKKQNITDLIHNTKVEQGSELETPSSSAPTNGQPVNISVQQLRADTPTPITTKATTPNPFFSGVVRNNKDKPIPNIMIYVNSGTDQPVRILKTNHNGVFATFHPLPSGQYHINPKDLGGTYFFDTMDLAVNGSPTKPVDIYSKELLWVKNKPHQ